MTVHTFLGGEITSTFDSPETVKLGHCDLIEEIMIGEDRLIKFSGKLTDLLDALDMLSLLKHEIFASL